MTTTTSSSSSSSSSSGDFLLWIDYTTIPPTIPHWMLQLHDYRQGLFMKVIEPIILWIVGPYENENDEDSNNNNNNNNYYSFGMTTTTTTTKIHHDTHHDTHTDHNHVLHHRRLSFLPSYLNDVNAFKETSMSFATLIMLFIVLWCVFLIFLSCFYHNQKTSPLFISPRRHRLPKLVPPPLPVDGYISWVRICFLLSDEEIIHRIGYDSLIFLRFHRLALRCIVKMSVFSFIVLLPLNFTGGGHANAQDLKEYVGSLFFTDFLRFTMANVVSGSARLWVHCFAAYLLTGIVMRELLIEYETFNSIRHRYLLSREPHLRTVLVTNIPRHLRSSSKISNYFQHVYPNAVKDVFICQNLIQLEKLVRKRTVILSTIEKELLTLCRSEKKKLYDQRWYHDIQHAVWSKKQKLKPKKYHQHNHDLLHQHNKRREHEVTNPVLPQQQQHEQQQQTQPPPSSASDVVVPMSGDLATPEEIAKANHTNNSSDNNYDIEELNNINNNSSHHSSSQSSSAAASSFSAAVAATKHRGGRRRVGIATAVNNTGGSGAQPSNNSNNNKNSGTASAAICCTMMSRGYETCCLPIVHCCCSCCGDGGDGSGNNKDDNMEDDDGHYHADNDNNGNNFMARMLCCCCPSCCSSESSESLYCSQSCCHQSWSSLFCCIRQPQERLASLYNALEELNEQIEQEQRRRRRVMKMLDRMEAGEGSKDIDYVLAGVPTPIVAGIKQGQGRGGGSTTHTQQTMTHPHRTTAAGKTNATTTTTSSVDPMNPQQQQQHRVAALPELNCSFDHHHQAQQQQQYHHQAQYNAAAGPAEGGMTTKKPAVAAAAATNNNNDNTSSYHQYQPPQYLRRESSASLSSRVVESIPEGTTTTITTATANDHQQEEDDDDQDEVERQRHRQELAENDMIMEDIMIPSVSDAAAGLPGNPDGLHRQQQQPQPPLTTTTTTAPGEGTDENGGGRGDSAYNADVQMLSGGVDNKGGNNHSITAGLHGLGGAVGVGSQLRSRSPASSVDSNKNNTNKNINNAWTGWGPTPKATGGSSSRRGDDAMVGSVDSTPRRHHLHNNNPSRLSAAAAHAAGVGASMTGAANTMAGAAAAAADAYDPSHKTTKKRLKTLASARHAIRRYGRFPSKADVNILSKPFRTSTTDPQNEGKIEDHINEVTDKAFVVMRTFTAATIAIQSMHSSKPGSMQVSTAPEPRDILWKNIYVSKGAHRTRTIVGTTLVWFIIAFYVVPVALVSLLVSESALISMSPRLAQLDQASVFFSATIALVQPLMIVGLQQLLPPLFISIGEAEGLTAFSEVQMRAFSRYFLFQVVNVFLVTTIAGSIFDTVAIIIEKPESAFEMLGSSLPRMSSFFIAFVAIKTFLALGFELVRIMALVQATVRYVLFPSATLRLQRTVIAGMRAIDDPGWFPFHKILAQDMLVVVISVVFAVVAPLVLLPVALFCLFSRIMWTHHHLYVYESVFESGGQFWPKIFRRFVFGLIIAQMTITGQFILKNARHEAYATIFLILITLTFLRLTRARYDPTSSTLPLEVATVMDISLQQEEDAYEDYQQRAAEAYDLNQPSWTGTTTSGSMMASAIPPPPPPPGTRIGRCDPFQKAYLQPALRANPRARPEQPFPVAQLGRADPPPSTGYRESDDSMGGSGGGGGSGVAGGGSSGTGDDDNNNNSNRPTSLHQDKGATVRLKSMNQHDRRLINRWWNDQLQRAGDQDVLSILIGEECGTLKISGPSMVDDEYDDDHRSINTYSTIGQQLTSSGTFVGGGASVGMMDTAARQQQAHRHQQQSPPLSASKWTNDGDGNNSSGSFV